MSYIVKTPEAVSNIGKVLSELTNVFEHPDFRHELVVYKSNSFGRYIATAYIIEYNYKNYLQDINSVFSADAPDDWRIMFREDMPKLELTLKLKHSIISESSVITLDTYYNDGDKFLKALLTQFFRRIATLAHDKAIEASVDLTKFTDDKD